MSKKDIKTNLRLSASFDEFVAENPDVLSEIPTSACFVMGSYRNPLITKKNARLARRIAKRDNSSCYQAVRQRGGVWEIHLIEAY